MGRPLRPPSVDQNYRELKKILPKYMIGSDGELKNKEIEIISKALLQIQIKNLEDVIRQILPGRQG